MGRRPCCDKVGLKKGPWTADEDNKLINFILSNAQCCWRAVPMLAGLLRCGKSCRLRWTNYLRPDLKRGLLSEYEEKMVIDLHAQLGNRWSKIASHLPGRTDNEIKNHWNTHINKKLRKLGIDPLTHKPLPISQPAPPQEQQVQDNETKSPVKSSITEDAFETMELMSNGFCIDEVPLIEPDEVLVPCTAAPSASSTTTSSSSSHGSNNKLLFGGFQFPDFEWPDNNDLWGDDFGIC